LKRVSAADQRIREFTNRSGILENLFLPTRGSPSH
jgi:hypothetical protein